ncbi:YbaB/EbfC family nucleoid-associated protein [Sphaerisporangium aureirubrum]|uniref:YbaB/EbfC family nucleoid-associated protein n=1 Tax=Sphaerisporangium aureirubrum TaxID=1544736 RepID=A0ABW1NIC6_9ACTN
MPPSEPWEDDHQRLELIIRQTEEAMRGLEHARAGIGQVTGEGEGADGMVRAVADGRGRLTSLDFNPRVMRLAPGQLGQEVAKAVQEAQDAAQEQTREIVGRAQARAAELMAEPLDETFVRRRVEQVARDIS